jgi:repressor LexA
MKEIHPKGLKGRRKKVLEAIQYYWETEHHAPSCDDIVELSGIKAKSQVSTYINELAALRYINHVKGKARSITLPNYPQNGTLRLPISGVIQAGYPIPLPGSEFSHFDSESYVEIAANDLRWPREQIFALRVQGDSMIDAMIVEGDVIILRTAKEARNRDMVAAWIISSGETTLKRFFLEGDKVRLQPENTRYKPIIVPAKDVEIQGIVVRLIRGYELNN